MNIQKIFYAVKEEEMSSSLAIVVWELEQQGYQIKLEGLEVTASEMENELFNDLERATNKFEIELLKGSQPVQRFNLVFTDYHELCFRALDFA